MLFNKRNIILIICVIILFLFDGCKSEFKDISGMYISFTDIRNILASNMDKEEAKKLFNEMDSSIMYGYNFMFLYINEDGTFYHYFSDKDRIIQETSGEINSSNNIYNFKGKTTIVKKNNEDTEVPFSAKMKLIKNDGENPIFRMMFLDQSKSLQPLYASTGYKKIKNNNDIMYLTFRSIEGFVDNIDKRKYLEKFPKIKEIFNNANNNIDKWKSLQIPGGFYTNNNQKDAFIYIDEKMKGFTYYEKGKSLYDGIYSYEGKNMIVIDFNKRDFLFFRIVPDFKENRISGFINISKMEFTPYNKDNYFKELDNATILELKKTKFHSKKLNDFLKQIEK